MPRHSFFFEVEVCGSSITGEVEVGDGWIDRITFEDGQYAYMGFDGKALPAHGTDESRALAQLVFPHINTHHVEDLQPRNDAAESRADRLYDMTA